MNEVSLKDFSGLSGEFFLLFSSFAGFDFSFCVDGGESFELLMATPKQTIYTICLVLYAAHISTSRTIASQ